ncbi:hypothetical protein HDA40_002672 [Hamadaea flava]|uniref:Uncharacterized protein n=1 Tax=Hamadaea flava TaxID=1742688 RepID=A0ABV8LML1_9ACTN|nr:hypothetical protein [Hamadaea flava]MCP2324165.1 hypothetical protein [Hamadaea flava]
MASMTCTEEAITIRFSGWERLWVGRELQVIPLAAIRDAAYVERPMSLARGARRGLVVSGFTKVGVWGMFAGPRQLVAARHGVPGVHLDLDRSASGGEFDEVIVSDPAAASLAQAIRHKTGARR